MVVPGTAARLFTHFLLPTIVMSRTSDQLQKCTRLLFTPSLADLLGPSAIDYLAAELQQGLKLRRKLSDDCLNTVAKNATLITTGEASGTRPVEKHSLYSAVYLSRTKSLLHAVRTYFDRADVALICDISMQREDAEQVLGGLPAGTFLLRFGSEAGTLVASTVVDDARVEHMQITLECLKKTSLEAILNAKREATMLLDASANKLYPKSVVMRRAYVDALELKEVVEQCSTRYVVGF